MEIRIIFSKNATLPIGGGRRMNKMAMTALGLGALFLMRNKQSREKLMEQFNNFAGMKDSQ
ncbi:hypothetical protein HMPREF9372_1689 [Sporosarcina newyorkensis 2681]|uniref:Uncharacterized protein n=2 Tax=Sporosarcina newyorkensis TaxID=759851 RepID=F9DSA9_9BACL|nr:hypothetical protein HMPREF9372_1689 [Sporosarcina newyorkensis 2681]